MNHVIWHGDYHKHLDEINIQTNKKVAYGCFGGATASGQTINEDGLFIAEDDYGVLAVLLDAHTTNESAVLILDAIQENLEGIKYLMSKADSMQLISKYFMDWIHDPTFIKATKTVKGETAFLVVYQKNNYLWWLSVGDNSLYLLHPEFETLGQIRVNQRVFFQWIGNKNSIDLEMPCYTQGTIELRQGRNDVVMLTDGNLECEGAMYNDPKRIYQCFYNQEKGIETILNHVKKVNGKDSATVITWSYNNEIDGLRPSR